ncbi:MAG: hypothetical protein P0Y53_19535 [Candidatus Pseudobacter hemicellulosilyticus]|uniref:Tetratricopeptide repeat protein n=1 Tax=Candidatus Pseudobacter hemicellulosilyticus TaxID=3121375 RepID=A0AAJ6BGE3_9BACT|nr:MAG: hypothetical protein P0Y53_19535 [Pseudobacter sp.]
MKKVVLSVLLATTGLCLHAQKLDRAKNYLQDKKLTDAKSEIDKVMTVEKNLNNPESWYYKGKIYVAVANDSVLRASTPEARETAFEAIKKYMSMEEAREKDSSKRNVLLTMDNSQPLLDMYAGYSQAGATYYNAGNFNDALANFRKCLEVFEFMSNKKLTTMKLDTTTTLYAGISAEKASKLDDAASFYGKIADARATGEGFAEIYKWLADHYRQKNDVPTAAKYSGLGKEVYPNDPFWTGFELDLMREKGTKDDLFKKYDEVVAKDPNNHLFLFNYGVEVYQAAYDQDVTKRPANSKELIAKASDLIKKSLAIKSDYPNANMVLGQIIYNEGVDFNTENKAIRPQGNVKLTPEQLKKKEELRTAVVSKFDEATPYFEKVVAGLDNQTKLKMDDKDILKNALDLMITINEEKTAQLEQKRNLADTKKQVAEVKALEEEIKKLQDKTGKLTEQFNNVDRKH